MLLAALTVLPILVADIGRTYVWNDYIPGRSVAFGVPDTDDRGLRIDCERRKGRAQVYIGGPVDADFGSHTTITIASRVGSRRFRSLVVEAGDGPNFTIPVRSDDDALDTLMSGRDIQITTRGGTWTVPGKGASRVLGPLIKACRVR